MMYETKSSKTMKIKTRTDGVANNAQSELIIKFCDRVLKVSLLLTEDELAPLFDGAAWAGTMLWDAAIQGVDYIVAKHAEILRVPGCRLIELGCGTGVPGMCCRCVCVCAGVDIRDSFEGRASTRKKWVRDGGQGYEMLALSYRRAC